MIYLCIGLSILVVGLLIYVIFMQKYSKKTKRDIIDYYTNQEKEWLNEKKRIEWNFNIKELSKKEIINENYELNQTINVIVADYNDKTSIHTNAILESMGFITEFVKEVEDLFYLLENKEYDLIIIGNCFPHYRGETILEKIKSMDQIHTPIIILTADAGKEKFFIRKCGFDGYLLKPLRSKELIDTLKKIYPKLKIKKIN